MIKKVAFLSLLSLGSVWALQAQATIVNWDLTAAPTTTTGDANVNSLTFSSGGHTVKATGYCSSSTTDSSGAMVAAHIQQYSGGLGIDSNGGSACSGDSVNVAPDHAIDNNGKDNFLLLEFDSVMAAQAFQIGWKGTDSDIQLWYGSSSLGAGLSLSGVNACVSGSNCTTLSTLGFTPTSQFNNVAINTSQTINSPVNSRYLIVSGALNQNDDFFKFNKISTKIPLPSTLLLFGVGLVGLHFRQRKRV